MSRVTTRNGLTALITNANLDYVGTVFPARPVIADETAYTTTMLGQAVQQTPSGSSALLVVNLISDKRQRRAITGRIGMQDTYIHKVTVEIFFTSTGPGTTGTPQGMQAQLDYDGIVDSLVSLIRENPTVNGTSWSAGEYEVGVSHRQGEPFTTEDGMTVQIVGAIDFDSWDWVTS